MQQGSSFAKPAPVLLLISLVRVCTCVMDVVSACSHATMAKLGSDLQAEASRRRVNLCAQSGRTTGEKPAQ